MPDLSTNAVTQHFQENPVSKVANKVAIREENPLDALLPLIYGYGAGKTYGFLNNAMLERDTYKNFLHRIDSNTTIKNIETATGNLYNRIKNNHFLYPIRNISQHFRKYWNEVKPTNGFAISAVRPRRGELTQRLIQKTGDILKKNPEVARISKHFSRGGDWKQAYDDVLKVLKKNNVDNRAINSIKKQIGVVTGKSERFLGKALRSVYAHTNGFLNLGSDPFTAVFTALFVGDAIKSTIEAPKGERVSTFAEKTADEIAPWMMMNTMLRSQYGIIGGLKNASKTKLPGIIKAPVAALGKFLSFGLEEGLKKNRGILSRLKGFTGGAIRLFAFMGLVMPLASMVLKPIAHKIFGKPTHNKDTETASTGTPAPISAPVPPLVHQYLNRPLTIGSCSLKEAKKDSLPIPDPIYKTSPEKITKLNSVFAKIDEITGEYNA